MPPFHLLVFISKLDFPFVENGAKNISFSIYPMHLYGEKLSKTSQKFSSHFADFDQVENLNSYFTDFERVEHGCFLDIL